jgi:GT2 family glycosyltransferase
MRPDSCVTVVTVTWNSQNVIEGFLQCLAEALGDVPWQLVIADNASADRTVELAQAAMPEARVVQLGRNAGYAAGINAAVAAAASGTHLLVSNPDIRLDQGAAETLVAALREPGVGIAVPQLRDEDGKLTFSIRRDATVLRALGEAVLGGDRAGRFPAFGETVTTSDAYTKVCDVEWASGAIMAISSECANTVGTWDESMWLYSEETDYCMRAREAGFLVRYIPSAHAVHIGGESGESPMLWTALTVNRIRLFARRHSRLHTAAFRAAVTLNEAIRALAGRSTSRAALRVLTRTRQLAAPQPPTLS